MGGAFGVEEDRVPLVVRRGGEGDGSVLDPKVDEGVEARALKVARRFGRPLRYSHIREPGGDRFRGRREVHLLPRRFDGDLTAQSAGAAGDPHPEAFAASVGELARADGEGARGSDGEGDRTSVPGGGADQSTLDPDRRSRPADDPAQDALAVELAQEGYRLAEVEPGATRLPHSPAPDRTGDDDAGAAAAGSSTTTIPASRSGPVTWPSRTRLS